jgi:hypothetical protein
MNAKEFFQVMSLNPVWRIKRHADHLKAHANIPPGPDKESFENVQKALETAIKRLRLYYLLRLLIIALLYLSLIAAVLREAAPFLIAVLAPARLVTAVLGVGLLSLLFLLITQLISAVLEDARTCHAHLVALAVKHNQGVAKPEHKYGLFVGYRND